MSEFFLFQAQERAAFNVPVASRAIIASTGRLGSDVFPCHYTRVSKATTWYAAEAGDVFTLERSIKVDASSVEEADEVRTRDVFTRSCKI